MTHIPKKLWQAALSNQETAGPPPVSPRGDNMYQCFLAGIHQDQINDYSFLVFIGKKKSDTQFPECLWGFPAIYSAIVNDMDLP